MLDNYRDLIDDLLGTPRRLRELVTGREPGAVPAPAVALMVELQERDRVVLDRLQRMTREQNAHLREFGPTPPAGRDYDPGLLDTLDTARGDLISLLMNLTLKDWERTATHELDGEITVAEEVERHVEFDENQVARIEQAIGDRSA